MRLREFLAKEGYSTVDSTFYEHIREWGEWYRGDVETFHTYKVYNGRQHHLCKRDSLNMAKRVCEDWANLLINERVHIVIGGESGGEAEQLFFDEVASRNNFWVKVNEMQEYKAAYGTTAYIPYALGVEVDEGGNVRGGGEIRLNYVTADNILPLKWENGVISECAFSSRLFIGQSGAGKAKEYLYLQRHVKENGLYVIYNDLFESNDGNLTPVPLGSVPEFATMATRVETGSPQRQFVIDRMAVANNIDKECPLGIAVFANAVGALRGADLIYDSYNNEFALGKKRIMVSADALHEMASGEMVYDPNDLVFYLLPGSMTDDQTIKEINMNLRAEEHEKAMQNRLQLISQACGFGEKHYRFEQGSVATATQVISENSQMFRTLKRHETILEAALVELARILLRMGRDVLGLPLDPDVEISVDFDDSIIEDKQSDFTRDWQMLAGGVIRPEEFRAKWMHEDIETARRNLPEMAHLDESVMI